MTRLAEGMKEVLHPSFQVNRYREYFEEFYEVFYEKNPINLKTAFTVAPSFIHVNSFMYEPLVDVGFEKLIEVAKDISSLVYNRA